METLKKRDEKLKAREAVFLDDTFAEDSHQNVEILGRGYSVYNCVFDVVKSPGRVQNFFDVIFMLFVFKLSYFFAVFVVLHC